MVFYKKTPIGMLCILRGSLSCLDASHTLNSDLPPLQGVEAVLHLYDGESFALLKRVVASSGGSDFFEGIHGPHCLVDKSFWPESPDKAAQDARVREAIRELVSQGMDTTLAELPLTE